MNVLEFLCTKDPRSPYYDDVWYDKDETRPEPRKDCFCDNCFYGRDALAVEILALQERLAVIEKNKEAI
jgi:hypothetical protein